MRWTLVIPLILILLLPLVQAGEDTRAETITWKLDDSPIYLESNFTVDAGQTLVIEPGVIVIFRTYGWRIAVYGNIIANGTEEQRITFTGTNNQGNEWMGIWVFTEGNIFENCDFHNGYHSIRSSKGSQTVKNCTVNRGAIGMRLEGEGNIVQGCTITDQNSGLQLTGGSNIVKDTTFRSCLDDALLLFENSKNEISNCRFERSAGGGMTWSGIRLVDSSENIITSCYFNNNNYAINLEGDCSKNLIRHSTFINNTYGFLLFTYNFKPETARHADENIIRSNTLEHNDYGIVLMGNSNELTLNTISSCKFGALYLNMEYTSNNLVYLNNFLNNSLEVEDKAKNTSYTMDNILGNYWSSANSTDENNDGVLDTAHGPDEHPLADPLEIEQGELVEKDTDGDGLPDYRDPDDDNDGILDRDELKNGTDPKVSDKVDEDKNWTLVIILIIVLILMISAVIAGFFLQKKTK